jgi:hypothetical protein
MIQQTSQASVSVPVIPFKELTTKYHFESCFKGDEVEKISNALRGIDFSNHLRRDNFKDTYYRYTDKKLESYFPPEWSRTATIRNNVLTCEGLQDFVIKVIGKSEPDDFSNPMASILRVPMAHLVQGAIETYKLDIEVPAKGLIPLPGCQEKSRDRYCIYELDEHTINEAFLVVARKINFIVNPFKVLKEMDTDKQEQFAYQACMIPEKTALADYAWGNLTLTAEHKLAVLDTEPLWGGLFVDSFGEGFAQCKATFDHWSFERSAKRGLQLFGKSSKEHDLTIFHDSAQKFLEKYD